MVAKVKKNSVPVHVRKIDNNFLCRSGDRKVTVDDNFTLADAMVKTNFNGKETIIQLIDKHPNGTYTIRFHGKTLN